MGDDQWYRNEWIDLVGDFPCGSMIYAGHDHIHRDYLPLGKKSIRNMVAPYPWSNGDATGKEGFYAILVSPILGMLETKYITYDVADVVGCKPGGVKVGPGEHETCCY